MQKVEWEAVCLWTLVLGVIPTSLGLVIHERGSYRREVARVLAPVPGTEGAHPIAKTMWRSASKVVCVLPWYYGRLLEVDARTGARRALPPLPEMQGVSQEETSVSPDGKWLLWPSNIDRWNVRALDGGPVRTWSSGSMLAQDAEVAWLPDSSGWVEVYERVVFTGRRVGHIAEAFGKRFLRVYRLKEARPRDIDISSVSSPTGEIVGVSVTPAGEAIVVGGYGGYHVARVPLGRPSQMRSLKLAPLPDIASGCLFSPRGDRIVWVFRKTHSAPWRERLWLSDGDGRNARPISPEMDEYSLMPTDLHWSHDGRRLFGWSDNRLVEIAVP